MTELWAVSVRGPDDLIPVASDMAAHRVAHAFNDWFVGYVNAKGGMHEYDAHMWASPVLYTGSAEDDAKQVAEPSPEYADLIKRAA